MNPPQASFRLMLSAALLVLAQAGAQAQTTPKPPPRLPPNPSETARIPAGVDSGSPATSDNLPLGTPVPPVLGADRNEMKNRSAAARSAARPKLGASSAADCTKRVAGDSRTGDAKAAPVALPGTGFLGSSAPPSTASQTTLARSPTRLDC